MSSLVTVQTKSGGLTAMSASDQWASRPPDQRFWSVEECLAAAQAQKLRAQTSDAQFGELRVEAHEGSLVLTRGRLPLELTNWSFGQLAGRVQAPAGFLRELPATLAAQVLNHRLAAAGKGAEGREGLHLLVDKGTAGELPYARAITSQVYGRVWDEEVLRGCLALRDRGWKVPPARPSGQAGERTRRAEQADLVAAGNLGLSVREGDMIAPAGVYRSDRDLWVIMIGDEPISDGTPYPLFRMIVTRNSEVGGGSWETTFGYLKGICGNHILHGLTDLKTVRTRHVGAARQRVARLGAEVRGYAQLSGRATEARILEAKAKVLAPDVQKVAELLFEKRVASREVAKQALAAAVEHEDWYGDPRSAWAVAQGMAEVSQREGWQGERAEVDKAAAKVLGWAF